MFFLSVLLILILWLPVPPRGCSSLNRLPRSAGNSLPLWYPCPRRILLWVLPLICGTDHLNRACSTLRPGRNRILPPVGPFCGGNGPPALIPETPAAFYPHCCTLFSPYAPPYVFISYGFIITSGQSGLCVQSRRKTGNIHTPPSKNSLIRKHFLVA